MTTTTQSWSQSVSSRQRRSSAVPESVCGLSEPFWHYLCRGHDAMYLLQEDQTLPSMEPSWLFDALFVLEGDCTCCFRNS